MTTVLTVQPIIAWQTIGIDSQSPRFTRLARFSNGNTICAIGAIGTIIGTFLAIVTVTDGFRVFTI